ncbi:tyrosine-type recombinase/integrase [Terrimonas sp. NA20]|uniref:Tyrosine-type recombinase/integrase n=1 Tax=Terrimonas ginsenosidimutans TaxID=2908004 RepID=A0ABS9L163_9BACT|nr:tyrosine-type recombinase/integrase [Terrimonas ginsenosidimutans]MCG2618197.1 tyrosine-type recombinase/integrase [Terrimonas ginsenosidimutans]
MIFTNYLQQKGYSQATVSAYEKYIARFTGYVEKYNIDEAAMNYHHLFGFLRYCNQQQLTKRTIHDLTGVIRHYFTYLIADGRRADNPAVGVFIKGLVRKLPSNLLTMAEMEELYQQYSLQLNVDAGKKSMLGLMIWQGLTVAEIMRLKIDDIKLKEGKVFIKGTARTNERTLELKAAQLPVLQSYLKDNRYRTGNVFYMPKRSDVSENNVANRIKHMFEQLKKLNPRIINAKQIRSSVITEWLKKDNLRQVQYMAGHKYVSSTERYQLSGLEDLQNELQHHHPMKE